MFKNTRLSSFKEDAESAYTQMSPGEKLLTLFFSFLLLLSTVLLLGQLNQYLTVEIPAPGGEVREGVIGFPRFVNPLLSSSDADRDLVSLVYSGLMKATPEGELVLDLAESYSVSDDGLVYTFILRDDIRFHDGAPVTADDVLFTISKTRDTIIKSPKRANWEGVAIEQLSDREVQFILPEPYSPFLENTTIGILPKHIWGNIEPEQFAFSSFNIEAVGSGPYEIKKVQRNEAGIPEFYRLERFSNYALGTPHIETISIHFYSNESLLVDGFRKGEIDSINSISTDVARDLSNSQRIEQHPLPRIFGVFFNQNEAPIFTHNEVRRALNIAVNRDAIVEQVLNGYGTVITGPIPGGTVDSILLEAQPRSTTTAPQLSDREARAVEILEEYGWEFNEELGYRVKDGKEDLVFSISTSNAEELKRVADIVKNSWERIGAKVTVELFEIGTLNQDVIRPRAYNALLFGEIVGREKDLFAFWHSSQRNDPGLNIALYANITSDKLLQSIRTSQDLEEREEQFALFEEEIAQDVPAVFLYSPDFIYIVPKKIKGLELGTVTTPAERFLSVHDWYINTDRVWKIFAQ